MAKVWDKNMVEIMTNESHTPPSSSSSKEELTTILLLTFIDTYQLNDIALAGASRT